MNIDAWHRLSLRRTLLLVLIVWWTMFSGRRNGELPSDADAAPDDGTVAPEATSIAPDDKPTPTQR